MTGILVAEEERFAFSYNITSLSSAMRRALNRERTNVGRTAYSKRVKSILLASKSTVVADILAADLMKIEQGANHDEVLWNDLAVRASRIVSAPGNVVFVTTSDMVTARDSIDHAESDGYQVVTLPDSISHSLAGLNDIQGSPVRSLSVYEQEWSESFQFTFIEPAELNAHEQQIFSACDRIAMLGLASSGPAYQGFRNDAPRSHQRSRGSRIVGPE